MRSIKELIRRIVDLKTFLSCQRASDNPDWTVFQGGLINSGSHRGIDFGTTLSTKRIVYCRFHPETGNIKNSNNPVNPVCFKDKIESNQLLFLTYMEIP